MCSITGIFSKSDQDVYQRLLDLMQQQLHRGSDSFGICVNGETVKAEHLKGLLREQIKGQAGIAHGRLAVTGHGAQPLASCNNSISTVHNGEIYNFEEMKSQLPRHKFETSTDSEIIPHFLEQHKGFSGIESSVRKFMQSAIGSYAVGGLQNGNLFAFRDPMGIKPVWFGESAEFAAFASEPLPLKLLDIQFPQPLLPGHLLTIGKNGIHQKKIFDLEMLKNQLPKSCSLQQLKASFHAAVNRRTNGLKKVGVFFSGGVDSALIAKAVSEGVEKVKLYTAGVKDSADVKAAEQTAKELNFDLSLRIVDKPDIKEYLLKTMRAMTIFDELQLEIAVPLYIAAEQAKKENCKVVFSGQGSDELFCGYSAFKNILAENSYEKVENEMWSLLKNMWSRNLFRDEIVTMAHTLELRLPYLDLDFVRHAIAIPTEQKILSANDNLRKHPLRAIAKEYGLSASVYNRPKKAVQYGSGIGAIVKKLL